MGALGLLLLAVGAILTFAVETTVAGVDIDALGVILMVVGAIGLLVALVTGTAFGFHTRRERVVSPDGSRVYEDDRTTRF